MRRYGIVIVLLCLFLLWLVLIAYLAGLAPEERGVPRINIGIVPFTTPGGPGSFSLRDTNLLAAGYQFYPADETAENEIYFILGRDVDEQGNATSWFYGVRHHVDTHILIYDRSGWKEIPWNGTLPDRQLDTGTFFPLSRLFQDNRHLLVQAPLSQRQVELYNNTYHISVSDGTTTRIYVFDAITGALM